MSDNKQLTDIQSKVIEVKADQINIRTDNLTKKYFNEVVEGATVTDRFNKLLTVFKEWKDSRDTFTLNNEVETIKSNLECIVGALEQAQRQGQTWADNTNREVEFFEDKINEFKKELEEHNALAEKVEELKQQLEKAIEKGTEARNNLGQASEKIIILEKENKELMKENKSLMEDKLKVSELRNRILELEKLNTEHKVAYGELMLDFSKLGTEKEELEKDLKEIEGAKEILANTVVELNDKNNELNKTIQKLEDETGDLSLEIVNLTTDKRELETQKEQLEKDINRLNSELEKIKKAQNNKNK